MLQKVLIVKYFIFVCLLKFKIMNILIALISANFGEKFNMVMKYYTLNFLLIFLHFIN